MKTIEEIMGLVDFHKNSAWDIVKATTPHELNAAHKSLTSSRQAIESALREMVERKPLSDEAIQNVFDSHHDDYAYGHINELSIITFAREVEKAHGIGA